MRRLVFRLRWPLLLLCRRTIVLLPLTRLLRLMMPRLFVVISTVTL